MNRSGSVLGTASLALSVLMLLLDRPDVVAAERDAHRPASEAKLRILGVGAYPDDLELQMGGVATMWAAQGHHVKFASLSNGDLGHWKTTGAELARRRKAEVQKADKFLGVEETEVLDTPDGEFWPSLELRKTVTRLIRRWRPDIVLTHRADHYHPTCRDVSVLVHDAAFMVGVPGYCPDVPALRKSPVYLCFSENLRYTDPTRIEAAMQPDIVVSVDEVFSKKIEALLMLQSQFIEGGCSWHPGSNKPGGESPKTPAEMAERRRLSAAYLRKQYAPFADHCRAKLIELYGERKGKEVRYVEAFKFLSDSPRPGKGELDRLFPSFGP